MKSKIYRGTRGNASERDEFTSHNPWTGVTLPQSFRPSTIEEVEAAALAAARAFVTFRSWSNARVADALLAVADHLDGVGADLIDAADRETGLGTARLTGELARTTAQFRAFASVCAEGSYVEGVIDHARPSAVPPIPDLRRMLVPVGPVAVFGASNFPLAFSVSGGDTASALAARCPVVVKAHPSHPETSDLAAEAIETALRAHGAPDGVFSLVRGPSASIGAALVRAAPLRAVAFTGSTAAGRALQHIAQQRPEPIPVYAEMGSLNPFVVTSGALSARGDRIAEGLVASVLQGSGQFCTKPGIVLIPESGASLDWAHGLAAAAGETTIGPLLNRQIKETFDRQIEETLACEGVEVLVGGVETSGDGYRVTPTVVAVDAATFMVTKPFAAEHFGPFCVLVRCASNADMIAVLQVVGGSLTGTIHAEPEELDALGPVLEVMVERVGRLVWNGYPTGVAISPAMMHGGPFPATTNPMHTSVGASAIKRFLRPVAYQNFLPHALPPELQDENPLGILRLVDGVWTRRPSQA